MGSDGLHSVRRAALSPPKALVFPAAQEVGWIGQRMAGSGSNSRKGFPEAGGECCQPQGQEEMMYLEGHMVLKPSPWAGHSHWQAQSWRVSWSQLRLGEGAGSAVDGLEKR